MDKVSISYKESAIVDELVLIFEDIVIGRLELADTVEEVEEATKEIKFLLSLMNAANDAITHKK